MHTKNYCRPIPFWVSFIGVISYGAVKHVPLPSTSNCLIFQVISEPHKLWHSTPCGCPSSKNYSLSFVPPRTKFWRRHWSHYAPPDLGNSIGKGNVHPYHSLPAHVQRLQFLGFSCQNLPSRKICLATQLCKNGYNNRQWLWIRPGWPILGPVR